MSESRKEREFKQREKEILETANSLFGEQGLDNVTVADIAKATDIGKGTIYKHFASKDVILARIGNDFSYSLISLVRKIDTDMSAESQMREMFDICFRAHIKSPLMSEICRLYQQPSFIDNLPEEYQKQCLEIEQEFFVVLNRICEQGKRNNELPDLSVDELIMGAHATFIGALEMLRSQQRKCFTDAPQLSQERFINIIINYTMTGIFGRRIEDQHVTSGEPHE